MLILMVSRLISIALLLQSWAPPPPVYPPDALTGPFNATFLSGGAGLLKRASLGTPSSWTVSTWVRFDEPAADSVLIGGASSGKPAVPTLQLAISGGHWAVWTAANRLVSGREAPAPGEWHFVAAASDQTTARLFLDGKEIASGSAMPLGGDSLEMAPVVPDTGHFAGQLASFTISGHALTREEIRSLADARPDFALIQFEEASKPWPVQTRAMPGYLAPQDPATLPHSLTAPSKPVAKPVPNTPALEQRDANTWVLAGAWRMIAAPETAGAPGEIVSQPQFDVSKWLPATVPGTVLTTYIDRGIYPDPDYGLNNLAIPESLNKQDYWYRTEWKLPAEAANHKLTLTFNGINYAAEVWFNGNRLGDIKGAFVRGVFDVSAFAKSDNVLAVRIMPPPHPGIPQEQSVKAGPGENGGMLCLDGPTFVATEGWDWIPGIRDRNIGIWQDVLLTSSADVHIGDAQVVTKLPLPDTSTADLDISVPLHNDSDTPVHGTLHVSFEGVDLAVRVTAPPGDWTRELRSSEFPQLLVKNPRLWWPNGYGKPDLYHLQLSFDGPSGVSDRKSVRFGIREVSYELSALDSNGKLERIEYSPADAAGTRAIDVTHDGMRISAKGWVVSLVPGAEQSPAIRQITDDRVAPYLIIRVNGVRIAAKGGNWGMDDSRKRVSREHLEPYFRLHRDANLNIIRNWVGQDTEETFYDLADEYGLMVWNDFWDSTQNYNLEPDDSALFLKNAADVITRFRNHPSIVIWCGRNEGVPAPAVNKGLDDLIRNLDGTRYYQPTSNTVNLQFSGPYRYQPPADYFTRWGRGFAVELGVPSFPTIDAFRAFVPEPDQWPPSDTWAYHDWHASGNGVVKPYLDAQEEMFGPSHNLDEFEKRAQMMNYVLYRAIFEGFNARLWTQNSGRLLWMTQPAWPSTMWQILSSDYDTQASFYGVKKASEPQHIQLNLPDLTIGVVNNTKEPLKGSIKASVYDLTGKQVSAQDAQVTVGPWEEGNSIAVHPPSGVASFIKLELRDSDGKLLSGNFYWQADQPSQLQAMQGMAQSTTTVAAHALGEPGGKFTQIAVTLTNDDNISVMNRVTVRHKDGTRILPAYYSDNYVSLLPKETRTIQVEVPAAGMGGGATVTLRGWNTKAATATVQ